MGLHKIPILALALALIACSTKKPDEPTVAQAPIAAADSFADKQDKAIERAAGYVKVAKDVNAGAEQTPPTKTVGVLLEAAGSYLDKPTQQNINHALALAGDHSKLVKVKEEADKTIKEINAAWETVVKDSERRRVEAEQNLFKKDLELRAANREKQDTYLLALGAGLIALGAFALIFGHWVGVGKMGAIGLMASGAGVAALPRLFDHEAFIWVSLSLIGVAGIQALFALWRRLFPKIDKPDPDLTI
jgi:hypothetical protein